MLLPGAAYPDWDAIYSDNVGRIYRLMFSKVGNRPDAEDLTSQVFLTAFGPLRATAEVAQVRAYLTATSRTVLADHWRRTLGHQVTEIDLETTDLENYTSSSLSTSRSPSADTDGPDTAEDRAARILEALPQRQRQVLVLRFLRGYTIRQAAAELGVSIANAKVLQHRALRMAASLESQKTPHDQHQAEPGQSHEHRASPEPGKSQQQGKSREQRMHEGMRTEEEAP